MSPSLDGAICRIMLLTSAAFSTWNNITIEFSTPTHGVAHASSMLLCSTDNAFHMDRVILYSLSPGGSLFSGETHASNLVVRESVITPSPFAASQPDIFSGNVTLDSNSSQASPPEFFYPGVVIHGHFRPFEAPFGLSDVLGSDPYYAGSYSNVR